MGQTTMRRPEPLDSSCMRPRRRMTPFSHSLMTKTEFQNQIRKMMKGTTSVMAITSLPPLRFVRCERLDAAAATNRLLVRLDLGLGRDGRGRDLEGQTVHTH